MARIDPLPEGPQKVRAVTSMFDEIAPKYDLVNRVMTFGMDISWRRRTVAALGLPNGSVVADVACGTGDLCRELRKQHYRAVGFDLSAGMLAAARTRAPLVLADALALPLGDAAVDGLTCGFALRNVADLKALFLEMARVVRPGGRIALLEVAEPSSPLVKKGHALYFQKVVPLIGGLLSSRSAYSYLPRSTAYLPPVDEMLRALEDAGFTGVRRQVLALGAAQLITASRA